ncbi:hypothetical protein AMK59_2017 [Oryctes borbonicus]|uniref:Uncharacterized protein n=1 Tax=Oryctes borbonicus TaxID=1629725 RepID=A0A0T6BFT2_9SCAR|nr:hypothetical protein AMK59_2017 [Oryctes borbonicus]
MQCYVSVLSAFSVLIALSHAAPAPQSSQGSFGFSAEGALNTTALASTFNQKVQLLRRFCPQLFQVIDNVVQNITSQIFSVVGRVILRNGLGGSGGGGGSVESRVSVVLPTFPPDDDDYDDEEDTDNTTSGGLDVRIVNSKTTTTPSSNEIPLSANDDTEGAPFTSPANVIDRSRRVIREAEADQEAAASGGNGPDPADLSDVDIEDSERDKRYLPFGGEAHVSAGGGSGNFLFDIIRLIAGSGATEESDEKDAGAGAGGVAEIDVAKTADGYTEGIPGPITRLFVIANRGLANLVQDLILRLAQTSERIVNFKARLITALI